MGAVLESRVGRFPMCTKFSRTFLKTKNRAFFLIEVFGYGIDITQYLGHTHISVSEYGPVCNIASVPEWVLQQQCISITESRGHVWNAAHATCCTRVLLQS